jgi:hypothetical protein
VRFAAPSAPSAAGPSWGPAEAMHCQRCGGPRPASSPWSSPKQSPFMRSRPSAPARQAGPAPAEPQLTVRRSSRNKAAPQDTPDTHKRAALHGGSGSGGGSQQVGRRRPYHFATHGRSALLDPPLSLWPISWAHEAPIDDMSSASLTRLAGSGPHPPQAPGGPLAFTDFTPGRLAPYSPGIFAAVSSTPCLVTPHAVQAWGLALDASLPSAAAAPAGDATPARGRTVCCPVSLRHPSLSSPDLFQRHTRISSRQHPLSAGRRLLRRPRAECTVPRLRAGGDRAYSRHQRRAREATATGRRRRSAHARLPAGASGVACGKEDAMLFVCVCVCVCVCACACTRVCMCSRERVCVCVRVQAFLRGLWPHMALASQLDCCRKKAAGSPRPCIPPTRPARAAAATTTTPWRTRCPAAGRAASTS